VILARGPPGPRIGTLRAMPTRVPNLGRTIRNIRRAREILSIFAAYGFRDVIQELDLDRLVLRGRRMIGLGKPGEQVTREPQAVRLRKAMESLGPTFIKLAQVLSTRPDLIPEEWAKEFAKLQSDVPPETPENMRRHIRAQFGADADELFDSIEYESMAAASIAQAHRATLQDGTEVLLKVLRPGVEEELDADIEILRALAGFVEKRFADLGYSPTQVLEQFERQVRREIDLRLELRSIQRMARAFEHDDRLRFPAVYPDRSTRRVLCMEHIHGVLLTEREEGTFSAEERREIVAIGSDAVFRQCFELGFFHADPHPGNIIVVRESDGLRFCFIDYGMMGHIDPRSAELLADLVQGTIGGDLDRVIDVVVELASATPNIAENRAFRADAWEFISRFQHATLADLQMGALLDEFFSKIRRNGLRVPADIVYLIKAITTIEGVGEAICPEFDIVTHVRPHVERLVNRRYGLAALRRRVRGGMLGYAELMERLPRDMRNLLHIVRHDQATLNLEHKGLDQITNELETASRNISYALVMSALIVGGSILILAETASGTAWGLLSIVGGVMILIAAAMSVALAIFRRRRL